MVVQMLMELGEITRICGDSRGCDGVVALTELTVVQALLLSIVPEFGVVALTELTVVQALLLSIVPEFANSGTIRSSKA